MSRKKQQMQLFVWDNVLCDYTDGLMFALAHSVEEARDLLREEVYDSDDLQQEPTVYDLTTPVYRAVWGGG